MTPVAPTLFDFTDRVALVTGGASGIGAAVVRRLLAGGARVAVFDLDAKGLPDGVLGLLGDVTRSGEVDAAVDVVERELHRLDILVCCAGVGGDSLHTEDVDDAEWRRVHAVNLDGTFFFNRAVVRGMREREYGRIVNVASIAGKEGNPLAAAYSSSKAAVIGLTKAIGRDLAGTGILVNCVAPALIETQLLDQFSQEHLDYMLAKIPLGRLGQPDEVAALVAWLASEEMSFSTGATFDVSGGRASF